MSMRVGVVLALLVASAARAEDAESSLTLEASAGHGYGLWSLLGDVGVGETTFLTLGYTGARPEAGTAATHQLSVGVDHLAGAHWLLSGAVSLGLSKGSDTQLTPEFPRRNLPGLTARTGYGSQGLQLAAGYDSAGFDAVEYGVDASLGLSRYPLRRQLLTVSDGATSVRYAREDLLWVARPTLGARLIWDGRWELGLRGGLSLYSEDPLTAGQFTDAEWTALEAQLEDRLAARKLLAGLRQRQLRDLGAAVTRRMADVNAGTGFPSAPARFDLKPSLSWRLNARVRAQLSYAFTRYVPTQGVAHVLATRWTVRLGDPVRLWASVALQRDVPEDLPGEASGLLTLGGEYTF
ncbi:hypothetical protein [Corallococcus llansteffanensis]|uniref:Uncharacterized protein n=1 Tax=Corallococcus llansteffanensis TaxID=2316731 RepID=A0A3A8Q653_9BACT|nr:hypothetical protein [Corallococcus llansteffanensis]RKH62430.1 hypothetical protein D7V93_10110 [Corallococcus llansteffanensis]